MDQSPSNNQTSPQPPVHHEKLFDEFPTQIDGALMGGPDDTRYELDNFSIIRPDPILKKIDSLERQSEAEDEPVNFGADGEPSKLLNFTVVDPVASDYDRQDDEGGDEFDQREVTNWQPEDLVIKGNSNDHVVPDFDLSQDLSLNENSSFSKNALHIDDEDPPNMSASMISQIDLSVSDNLSLSETIDAPNSSNLIADNGKEAIAGKQEEHVPVAVNDESVVAMDISGETSQESGRLVIDEQATDLSLKEDHFDVKPPSQDNDYELPQTDNHPQQATSVLEPVAEMATSFVEASLAQAREVAERVTVQSDSPVQVDDPPSPTPSPVLEPGQTEWVDEISKSVLAESVQATNYDDEDVNVNDKGDCNIPSAEKPLSDYDITIPSPVKGASDSVPELPEPAIEAAQSLEQLQNYDSVPTQSAPLPVEQGSSWEPTDSHQVIDEPVEALDHEDDLIASASEIHPTSATAAAAVVEEPVQHKLVEEVAVQPVSVDAPQPPHWQSSGNAELDDDDDNHSALVKQPAEVVSTPEQEDHQASNYLNPTIEEDKEEEGDIAVPSAGESLASSDTTTPALIASADDSLASATAAATTTTTSAAAAVASAIANASQKDHGKEQAEEEVEAEHSLPPPPTTTDTRSSPQSSTTLSSSSAAGAVQPAPQTKVRKQSPPSSSPPEPPTTSTSLGTARSSAPPPPQATTTSSPTSIMGRKFKRDNSQDDWEEQGPDNLKEFLNIILGPSAAEILYWRDPKKSGPVFAIGLVILLALSSLSVISVVAYTLFFTLLSTLSFRIYKNVMQAVQKTSEGHPFKEYLELEITPSQERVHEIVDQLLVHLNCTLNKVKSVLLVEDLIDSLKYLLIFWSLTYIGAWFNGLTLVILAYIGAFSLPKVYELNKSQIDHYIELITTKINEISEKVPFLKKAVAVPEKED